MQELYEHAYSLYYYNSKKKGELVFVIEHAGKALPIYMVMFLKDEPIEFIDISIDRFKI